MLNKGKHLCPKTGLLSCCLAPKGSRVSDFPVEKIIQAPVARLRREIGSEQGVVRKNTDMYLPAASKPCRF